MGGNPSINLGEGDLPWHGAAKGPTYSESSWSQTVLSVEDLSLDPRMQAQEGCFFVGGLTRRGDGETWKVGGSKIAASDWPDITTFRILFPQSGATKAAGPRWPAVAWSLRVPASLKGEVREMLAEHYYTADHMYPDYGGSRRLGTYVAQRWEA